MYLCAVFNLTSSFMQATFTAVLKC